MTYRTRLATIAPDVPAHIVEAHMRAGYGTLDALSAIEFDHAALISAQSARAFAPDFNDALCASYGLRPEVTAC